jgi:ADP-ribosylglycohydrolase
MRTLCVGAYYNKEKDLDKLIKFCIETGRTTHPSPIGYLGGVTSAYFVHLALNKIDIKKWPFLLLELIESDKVLSYISSESHDEIIGYRRFISLWKKYIELRFKDKEPIFTKSHTNLIFRTKFFYDFTINYDEFYNEKIKDDSFHLTIGGSGVTSMIMAYDALLDAKDSWEKLVYYSMLHVGDSDTVGAIAGGIYGAIYGFKNVPEHMLKHIEKKEELIKLAEEIFENNN